LLPWPHGFAVSAARSPSSFYLPSMACSI
jgi:hypothetical protein